MIRLNRLICSGVLLTTSIGLTGVGACGGTDTQVDTVEFCGKWTKSAAVYTGVTLTMHIVAETEEGRRAQGKIDETGSAVIDPKTGFGCFTFEIKPGNTKWIGEYRPKLIEGTVDGKTVGGRINNYYTKEVGSKVVLRTEAIFDLDKPVDPRDLGPYMGLQQLNKKRPGAVEPPKEAIVEGTKVKKKPGSSEPQELEKNSGTAEKAI